MPPEDTSPNSPQEPVQDTPQPAPEVPEPVAEAPAPVTEPATPPQEAEPIPVPEVAPSEPTIEPQPAEASPPDENQGQTAQTPPSEPIATESESVKPTPEPSSATARESTPIIQKTGILHTARELLAKARVAIQDRKRKKRDKIMQALVKKNKITNDDVEKLLHVSDATATRYLSALVKEGKIKQIGRTGAGVMYSRAP